MTKKTVTIINDGPFHVIVKHKEPDYGFGGNHKLREVETDVPSQRVKSVTAYEYQQKYHEQQQKVFTQFLIQNQNKSISLKMTLALIGGQYTISGNLDRGTVTIESGGKVYVLNLLAERITAQSEEE